MIWGKVSLASESDAYARSRIDPSARGHCRLRPGPSCQEGGSHAQVDG